MDIPALWDEKSYLQKNRDVKDAILSLKFKSGWEHYLTHGIKEKRFPHWIDPDTARNRFRVNCVIATWSGPRRAGNDKYHTDPTTYLKAQIASLQKFKHGLAQITIAVPENPREPADFTNYLNQLPTKIGTVDVVIIRRKNVGQSYGSYSDIYLKYGRFFDYYILIEDDYVFVKDHFDLELMTQFELKAKCGFLCQYVSLFDGKWHAAISNGITKSEILEKIVVEFDRIPHGPVDKFTYGVAPQLEFSWAFMDVGYVLYDLMEKYRAPYNDAGKLKFYGNKSGPDLLVPVQFLDHLGYQL